MPSLEHLPADAPTAEIMAVLDRDGALILDDALSAAEVDALVAELTPYVDATPTGKDSFTGSRTTRTGALVARSPRTRPLVMDARVLALAEALLKPNCHRYQLHLAQVIRIMPGQPAQAIHRDRWAWGRQMPGIEPQLNTIWALTDFTAANGATQVCPGSQAWPDDRKAEPHEIARAEMRKGSVLIYTGTVFHSGGANDADPDSEKNGDRWGLNITYSLGWLRQEENMYLSCPPEEARKLEPELAALVGYAMSNYALGYYTPPLPAGAGPETVPPEWSLGVPDDAEGSLGGAALLAEVIARASEAREAQVKPVG
ncbi:phytanoyl-CoA dioxygenase family protein [Phenylobacterium sp.]|uniref:phytanoyl-CoA dioxygenase family protein n=1 Tax=Phenylobacterium sp. TaxID=1871053 RepID=UPI0025E83B6D|nr:phytanoyl-CoA dioxygenase family protein [Phenylobacterium sp.]MBX3484237.1 phytanoyl-CoA dioxygenase family protein [Phenylobacterium sp.]MCW5760223.1 phytanoyl-CoA dioxygenase family protein [Phenylobacterium sp.]